MENSIDGCVFDFNEQKRIADFARANNILLHLDGARLWNVAVACNMSVAELCAPYNSVSLCLSKGLGAPVGSVLVGSLSFIKRARHIRKLFGGGWRQAGVLAACGLYALENNVKLLEQTHLDAQFFASSMVAMGFTLHKPCDTNMVWIDGESLGIQGNDLAKVLKENDIAVFGGNSFVTRFVFHFQVQREMIEHALKAISNYIESKK
jgi:threonine aldolase